MSVSTHRSPGGAADDGGIAGADSLNSLRKLAPQAGFGTHLRQGSRRQASTLRLTRPSAGSHPSGETRLHLHGRPLPPFAPCCAQRQEKASNPVCPLELRQILGFDRRSSHGTLRDRVLRLHAVDSSMNVQFCSYGVTRFDGGVCLELKLPARAGAAGYTFKKCVHQRVRTNT